MAFIPDKPNSRFVPDSPKSRFTPDVTPEIVPARKAPAYGGKEGLKRLAFGGPTGYLSASGSEDVLPMVGQTVGSSVGGYGGSVAGATIGQGARQGIKAIRGTRESAPRKLFGVLPKAPGIVNDLAGEAAGTAAMEGVFRAIPKVLFPKQIGAKTRDAVGKKLGNIASEVQKKAPFLNTPKKPLIDEIENEFKTNLFERGPAKNALAQAKKALMEKKTPLTFDEAIQLERQLGREAQFASDATQGKFTKAPKAPRFNQAIKGLRSKVSAKVDEMAAQAGFPEYESVSRNYANLVKKYPEAELQKLYSPTGQFIRGATMAGAGAIPMVAGGAFNPILAGVGAWASLSPKYKTLLFRKVVDTPLGRGAGNVMTKGATELVRKFGQS